MFKTIIEHTGFEQKMTEDRDTRFKIANTMIDRDYPVAEIAKITGLSIDQVETLK